MRVNDGSRVQQRMNLRQLPAIPQATIPMLRLLGVGSNPAGEESSGSFDRTGSWRRRCRVRGGQDSADDEGVASDPAGWQLRSRQ
jgi:hypothetical protein